MTLTFNIRRTMTMIHIRTKTQVQWLVGSKDSVKKTDGQTDGQEDATDRFTFLANAVGRPN